ncbi:MAG: hypothetical protein ABR588_09325 [Sphingomicrobium sp.]|nr:hypothetical protein [Sphingomonadales bacterium]
MRASLLLLLLLTACTKPTPEQRVEHSTKVQQRIEAVPPDGNAQGTRVAIDDDAATPISGAH